MSKVKVRKQAVDNHTSSELAHWSDKDLSHVLEAYNLPPKYTEDDLMHELAKHDCANVSVYPVDDAHCLVVCASANAGKNPKYLTLTTTTASLKICFSNSFQ